MQIVPATERDLDAVAELFDQYRQFYRQPSDLTAARAFIRARMQTGESLILVARQDGELLGFTQLYPTFSSVSMAPVLILNDLFVAATARRRGVAGKLMEAAVALARGNGYLRLQLETEVTNTAAQALYERDGWVRDDEHYHYSIEADGRK